MLPGPRGGAGGGVCAAVWLRAGEAAVEVSLSGERPEEVIPEVGKAHL